MAPRNPEPAYPARNRAAIYGDEALYEKIGKIAESKDGKSLVQNFEIPIRSGKAWVVNKGQFSNLNRNSPSLKASTHFPKLNS